MDEYLNIIDMSYQVRPQNLRKIGYKLGWGEYREVAGRGTSCRITTRAQNFMIEVAFCSHR